MCINRSDLSWLLFCLQVLGLGVGSLGGPGRPWAIMNNPYSNAIAWEALDEIHRDVEGFLRTVTDLPELRRSSGSSAGGRGGQAGEEPEQLGLGGRA